MTMGMVCRDFQGAVPHAELNDVELPLRNNVDLAHCDVRLRTSEAIAWEQLLRPEEVSRRSSCSLKWNDWLYWGQVLFLTALLFFT